MCLPPNGYKPNFSNKKPLTGIIASSKVMAKVVFCLLIKIINPANITSEKISYLKNFELLGLPCNTKAHKNSKKL